MGEIKIGRITLGSYMTNCYFLYREGENEAIVIDPADNGDYIYNGLLSKGITVKAILLTHGHFDHIYGVRKLKELSEVKVYAFEGEAELLNNMKMNVSAQTGRAVTVIPDVLLKDDECVTISGMTFKTIHTPGHTQGSACYYFEEAGILVAGDTLFAGSVGRSDLPTGSAKTLIDSITERLCVLPDNTRVYPGHGEKTTIGWEKDNNPFL